MCCILSASLPATIYICICFSLLPHRRTGQSECLGANKNTAIYSVCFGKSAISFKKKQESVFRQVCGFLFFHFYDIHSCDVTQSWWACCI